MGTTEILMFAVIALFLLVAYFASGVSIKNKRIKILEELNSSLSDKLDKTVKERFNMENKFRNLEKGLANNLVAITNEGEEIDYFRIKVMGKDDDFDGYNIGDKVPHIRRKVKYVWKNVPITLKLKRQ